MGIVNINYTRPHNHDGVVALPYKDKSFFGLDDLYDGDIVKVQLC